MSYTSGVEEDTFEIDILSIEDSVTLPPITPSVPQRLNKIWVDINKWSVH